VGAFLAVRAAGSGVVHVAWIQATTARHEVVARRWVVRASRWPRSLSGWKMRQRVSRPHEREQRIDDLLCQAVRAEPLRVLGTPHARLLSFLIYLY
jgi:hypothetical protein